MIIESSHLIAPGFQVLWKGSKVVWMGRIGAPIEDAVCDKIQMNPIDYDRLKAETAIKRTSDDV